MKRILIFVLLITSLVNTTSFSENIILSGSNYILMEENSGRVLEDNNAHEKMPMASTTKIMTALLAIEMGNLEESVEITNESVGIIGSSIYLEQGENIKLEDLIYGLMLRSGNDAATAIAIHISGSVDEFVEEMNNKAREIGANNTNFVNPHGLHDDNHYSTPYDMALITRESLLNENFSAIWSSKSFTSVREKNNYFVNKNKTLWEYEGGDGGKTGYTSNSGRCLVSTATRNDMRLIAVSFNASDWFNDNYKLFDYGFDNFSLYTIYSKGQLLERIKLEGGLKDELILVSDDKLVYPLLDEEIDKIKLNIEVSKDVSLPVFASDKYGYVKTFLNDNIIKNDYLIAKYEVSKKPFLQKLMDMIENRI